MVRGAHAGQAKVFVVAIADRDESLRVVEAVKKLYPSLPIIACARRLSARGTCRLNS